MMIYHVSVEADAPRHVATVLAELMGGVAAPFPPVAEGSWIAIARDRFNSAVEVYPRGTRLYETPGDADAHGRIRPAARHGSTHIALGVTLSESAVVAIAAREGWPAKYRKRGGAFGVLELWVEGCLMIEVLTPAMQDEYLHAFTADNWLAMLATGPAEMAASAAAGPSFARREASVAPNGRGYSAAWRCAAGVASWKGRINRPSGAAV